MRSSILLLSMFLVTYSLAQIQSDTGLVVQNEKFTLKLNGGYFGGSLSKKERGKNWSRVTIHFSEIDNGSKISILSDKRKNAIHSFMPYGGLSLNDSVSFLVGVWSTFGYQGVILKSTNKGKDWKIFLNKNINTPIGSKDLLFLTDSVGIVKFGNEDDVGITFNQGQSWELQQFKDNGFYFKKGTLIIMGKVEPIYTYSRILKGRYTENGEKTWENFEFIF